MSMQTNNPREAIGGNNPPDWAKIETDRLKEEYPGYRTTAQGFLAEIEAMPEVLNTREEMVKYAGLVKRIDDVAKLAEDKREVEKAPHLRRGQAVDQYFGAVIAYLRRAKRTDKPGLRDTVQGRIDDCNQRLLAEERRKREEAERLAREETARRERERAESERKEREAREAAERARKPERKAELEKEASDQAAVSAQARADESVARADLSNARLDKAAPSADLVRTRGEDGVLVTMKQEGYAEFIDSAKLSPADIVTLWSYVKEDHRAMALRAWGKITQYKKPMEHTSIGMRDVTVIR